MEDRSHKAFHLSDDKLELLDLYLEEEGFEDAALPKIEPRDPTLRQIPLSFAQQRLWFLEELLSGKFVYNTPVALRLSGPLDVSALEKAFGQMIRRHEILRTTFTPVDGTPVQIVHDDSPFTLPILDLQNVPDVAQDQTAQDTIQETIQQPFDFVTGPLWRIRLLRFSETDHIFLLVLHHIVMDGWSMKIILGELTTLYEAYRENKEPDLPQLSIQYADFALWQREWLDGEIFTTQLAYWRKQLNGRLPILQLPTDYPRPAVKRNTGRNQKMTLSPRLSRQLNELSKQEGATLFMVLLTAFNVLLYRYSAQTDILVGTPIANRNRLEIEDLIGFFVNTLVIRTQLHDQLSFRELLRQVCETTMGAYDHQDLPFEKLVEVLQPERHLNVAPLFQVMFSFREQVEQVYHAAEVTFAPAHLERRVAQFDLSLSIVQQDEALVAIINYSTELFAEETIKRMLGHLQTLLAGIVANPDQTVAGLPVLTAAERRQTLLEWNKTSRDVPQDRAIPDLFALQAAKTPGAPAAVLEQVHLTYDELNRRANQLAHHLQSIGVGPDSLVGLMVDRSPEMLVGILGILKAGGAYLPLDPAYPPERIEFMLADSQTKVLLSQQQLVDRLPAHQITLFCLDADWHMISGYSEDNPVSHITGENMAYVIYTSGSTGRPKGVMVTHSGVVNYLTWVNEQLLGDNTSEIPATTSITFDASLRQILAPLLCGRPVRLLPQHVISQPDALLAALAEYDRVAISSVPSFWQSIVELLSANPARWAHVHITHVIVGGEAPSESLIQRTRALLPDVVIWNVYGPTEITVNATATRIEGDDKISIGYPIANTETYILDSQLRPVPIGVPGEIYIGGVGVARGYLNRPALTAEKFIPNPFVSKGAGEQGSRGADSSLRLYKTGDVAKYRPDGAIVFLGRVDHQVKIRGFRIELGEIETVLQQHTAVQDVLVVALEDSPGNKRLVAYLVCSPANLPALRPWLRTKLPEYMIPASFVTLDALPLTANGKIDRKALPALDAQLSRHLNERLIAPRDGLESQLVRIWADILGLKEIGVTDNYFDLGGHSLQAVTLFAMIEKKMGINLPLAVLFQAPTVAQMAETIRDLGAAHEWSSLVPIQPQGMKKPFFCVHGGAGHIFHYHDLAQSLGEDQPFYALQPKMSLDDNTRAAHARVEEMAAHYISEMRTVQPEGPYLLGGFCFGGVVAFEMAQQLRQAGQEVPFIAFIDPSTPNNRVRGINAWTHESFYDRAERHRENMNQLAGSEKIQYMWQRIRHRIVALWSLFRRALGKKATMLKKELLKLYLATNRPVPRRFRDFYFMQIVTKAANHHYNPEVYPGKAILFRSILEGENDPKLGWDGLPAEGLQVYDIEANHLGILKRPHIEKVAQTLRTHIEAAQLQEW